MTDLFDGCLKEYEGKKARLFMLAVEFNRCLETVRGGDVRGFEAIFVEYYEKAVSLAYIRVGMLEAAQDVASDFVFHLFRKACAGDMDYIYDPDSWVCKCVRDMSVDYIRRERRRSALSFVERYERGAPSEYPPDDGLFAAVKKEIERFGGEKRELFVRRCVHGMSYKELSILKDGTCVGTLKRRVSEMKKTIKNRLSDVFP